MNIALDDIGAFVFSELVQSPSLGKITREGFLDGCIEANVDSVAKMQNLINARKRNLGSEKEVFRNIYNHSFLLGLAPNAKSLALDDAAEFWTLLFGPSGLEWRTARTPWLEWWLEFLRTQWKRAVNKDLWRQTLTFARETLRDEGLGFWSEESSWPSVIDDFVEWVKVQKRGGGGGKGGEAMDTQ